MMMLEEEAGKSGGGTYRTAADESVSGAVVRAVSCASGRSPLATGDDPDPLDPLYGAIDPDALDALFRGAGQRRAAVWVEFVYCGHEVRVDGTGEITVTAR